MITAIVFPTTSEHQPFDHARARVGGRVVWVALRRVCDTLSCVCYLDSPSRPPEAQIPRHPRQPRVSRPRRRAGR